MFKKIKPGITKGTAVVLMLALAAISGTFAYLTDWRKLENKAAAGDNTITIIEEFDPPKEMHEGENEYAKKVQIKNTGTIDCYIRVFADFSESDIKDISKLHNGTAWVNASDYALNLPEGWYFVPETDPADGDQLGGYYYYDQAIKPGDSTKPLFTRVMTTFASEADVRNYEIIVYAESLQTLDRNGDPFTGADAWKNAWIEFLANK